MFLHDFPRGDKVFRSHSCLLCSYTLSILSGLPQITVTLVKCCNDSLISWILIPYYLDKKCSLYLKKMLNICWFQMLWCVEKIFSVPHLLTATSPLWSLLMPSLKHIYRRSWKSSARYTATTTPASMRACTSSLQRDTRSNRWIWWPWKNLIARSASLHWVSSLVVYVSKSPLEDV